MAGTPIGTLPDASGETPVLPQVLTRVIWALFLTSVGILAVHIQTGTTWTHAGIIAIDGLTALMWVVVTFFSGIVHSYSRRYMARTRDINRFFGRVFLFTLVVMGLVAADHLLLFGVGWLTMGLLMAGLIGHVRNWPQAQAAASIARQSFLASSAMLGVALGILWWVTGATTVSGVAAHVNPPASPVLLVAAGALLLAAMIQSALVPFHTWLLSSMTAPTPASALMHAGFVNAGGILLLRFAPIVTLSRSVMLVIVLVGASSALLGKLAKAVQPDTKARLGCSTTGQMGFMIMQAGLGFFGAAVTHLILHGCYKAYLFLSTGEEIAHTSPQEEAHHTGELTVGRAIMTGIAAVAGGGVFAILTGKGTGANSGLLLTGLVVLTTLHATRSVLGHSTLPARYGYGVIPLVLVPAIAIYGLVYTAIGTVLASVPLVTAPAALGIVHGGVAVAFLLVYLAIETGVYRHSTRLYVMLVNLMQAPQRTLLTSREEYNEY